MSRANDPRVVEFADVDELFRAARDQLFASLRAALASRGTAHLALAGGSTPRRLYALSREIAFDAARVHFWWGDERCVPPQHPDSNYRMAWDSWLCNLDAPQLHRVRGELSAVEAAAAYAHELATAPALDLALLGLGEDGHTASLFPGRPEASDDTSWAVAARAPQPPSSRVSMGLRPLLAARKRIFLVVGNAKAPALQRVLAGEGGLAASRLAEDATFFVSPPRGAA